MVLHDGYEQTSRDIDSVCPGTYQKVLNFFHLCKRIYDATSDFTMVERTAHPNGCAVLSIFKENLAALQKKKCPVRTQARLADGSILKKAAANVRQEDLRSEKLKRRWG